MSQRRQMLANFVRCRVHGTVFEILKTDSGYGPLTTLVSFNNSNSAQPGGGLRHAVYRQRAHTGIILAEQLRRSR
jgi:hypothetical protein